MVPYAERVHCHNTQHKATVMPMSNPMPMPMPVVHVYVLEYGHVYVHVYHCIDTSANVPMPLAGSSVQTTASKIAFVFFVWRVHKVS